MQTALLFLFVINQTKFEIKYESTLSNFRKAIVVVLCWLKFKSTLVVILAEAVFFTWRNMGMLLATESMQHSLLVSRNLSFQIGAISCLCIGTICTWWHFCFVCCQTKTPIGTRSVRYFWPQNLRLWLLFNRGIYPMKSKSLKIMATLWPKRRKKFKIRSISHAVEDRFLSDLPSMEAPKIAQEVSSTFSEKRKKIPFNIDWWKFLQKFSSFRLWNCLKTVPSKLI